MSELMRYLPPFLHGFEELRETLAAEDPTVDTAWADVQRIWDEQFIQTCSEAGIRRWERMLGIVPETGETVEDRRFRILGKLTPFNGLHEYLTAICGEGNFFVRFDGCDAYHVTIGIAVKNAERRQSVHDQLLQFLPANLEPTIRIAYNQHNVLHAKMHAQMENYTHRQIRWEVPL